MKSSAFDTFCRALVLGAVFGALGWGAVRYTNLPQVALKKIVALSREVPTQNGSGDYVQDASVISATSTAPSSYAESYPSGKYAHSDSRSIPIRGQVNPDVSQQPVQRLAQQAAYLEPTTPAPNGAQSFRQTVDDRRAMEQRLCDLGAVYSLLEMWGHEKMQYRFHCRVSITNNRQVTRSFEANGMSPEDAMRQVLKEVEGFQSTSGIQGLDIR